MTESDLIWLAPWAVFAAGLTAVALRLRRARQPDSARTPAPLPGPAAHARPARLRSASRRTG